jgi:hypothetical protein
MKTTQKNQLLKLIEQQGWQQLSIEGEEQLWSTAEWFIAELWELQSVWTPKGFRVFISFVIDPQNDYFAKRWQSVWAVKATLQRPTTWGFDENEVGLVLGRGWQAGLPTFIRELNGLRVKTDKHELPTLLA